LPILIGILVPVALVVVATFVLYYLKKNKLLLFKPKAETPLHDGLEMESNFSSIDQNQGNKKGDKIFNDND
jgi:hypothetical protein